MAAGASLLAPLLELPAALLFWAGLALVPFVAMLLLVARRPVAPRPLLTAIVATNALWVIGSFALLLSTAIAPNMLGVAFVTAQALAVALFAGLQWVALGKAPKLA